MNLHIHIVYCNTYSHLLLFTKVFAEEITFLELMQRSERAHQLYHMYLTLHCTPNNITFVINLFLVNYLS